MVESGDNFNNEFLTITNIDDHHGEVECDILVFKKVDDLSIYGGIIPDHYSIRNIYPNPFNPVVNITYALSELTNVKLIIYDLTGKQVESLVDKFQSPGYHIIKWNADGYPSGAYFIRMSAADYVGTQKLMLVK